MKKRRWYPALPVVTLTVMTVPVLSAEEQGSTQSPSAPEAMPILKKMSNFLAAAERFSVTIHDGYDVVQESGQKIEFGELRSVALARDGHRVTSSSQLRWYRQSKGSSENSLGKHFCVRS